MKNCSKNSHVITAYNRQNSFHAINRLKIQHIDNILKLYFLNLVPMTVAEDLATTRRKHRLSHHSFRPCARKERRIFPPCKSVVVFDNKEIRVRDMVAERLHPLPKRQLKSSAEESLF